MAKIDKTTTDKPRRKIYPEMQTRINEGRLDYRKGIGWHDPRGYDPVLDRFVQTAIRY